MRQSMTGFASAQGAADGLRWTWEVRSVNGKGLDLRTRVPDWIEGLEAGLKAALKPRVSRGNVTIGLRLAAEDTAHTLSLNAAQMRAALDALEQVETEAMERGMTLAPSKASDILALRGVMDTASEDRDPAAVCKVLMADVAAVLDAFVDMRATEGAALQAIIAGQLDDIDALTTAAAAALEDRRDEQETKLINALKRVSEAEFAVDPERLAQEFALIAVKSDITEELDRLRAHITAARALLATDGPIGRKFDFLMQEFNREANTLCSKSQSSPLTAIGLELKTVIDQLREQVQNVE